MFSLFGILIAVWLPKGTMLLSVISLLNTTGLFALVNGCVFTPFSQFYFGFNFYCLYFSDHPMSGLGSRSSLFPIVMNWFFQKYEAGMLKRIFESWNFYYRLKLNLICRTMFIISKYECLAKRIYKRIYYGEGRNWWRCSTGEDIWCRVFVRWVEICYTSFQRFW